MKHIPGISLLTLASVLSTASAQIPRFLNPVSLNVPGASMAVLADVNGDHILDIVTANGNVFNGSGVSLLLGRGDGTFQPARTIVAAGNPSYVVVADFNHDGKPDIAVANEPDPNTIQPTGGAAPNSVSILLGNGDGTFQAPINTATFGALTLAAADFNADGKLDLAVSTGNASPVQVLLGNGDGTFTVTSTPIQAASSAILVGDFNRDGKLDILAGGFEIFGNGDGTFNLTTAFPALGGPYALGDFNGDGVPDLAGMIVNGGGSSPPSYFGKIFFGVPDGTWTDGPFTPVIGFTNFIATDFNGDGKRDLFSGGSLFPTPGNPINGSAQLLGGLFLGAGTGNFTQAASGFGALSGVGEAFTAAGDIDGNGSPDVVIANGTGLVVARNTFGNPPLLAQAIVNATSVVGAAAPVTGSVSVGGPAPAGGAVVTLSSSSPSALLSSASVTIPAGSQTAPFSITTGHVAASTPVTITASYHAVTQTASFSIVPPSALASVSGTSVIGMFGGAPAVGTVTLSGPAPDGTVVTLTSANKTVLSVPVNVAVAPGATTATFPMTAQHVAADTVVNLTATLAGTSKTGAVTVKKETATVTVTKAEYVVKKGQLTIEATSPDIGGAPGDVVPNLRVYNALTGTLVGSVRFVGAQKGNIGIFTGQFLITGSFTSVAVQSYAGGLAIAPVAQK